MPLLSIENLSIEFGSDSEKVKAVNQVSFQIEKGVSFGLVGESGSGKSVTALAIMQLLAKQAKVISGKILFKDTDILEMDFSTIRKLRGNNISMIFQEPMTSLNPVMRCGNQVIESICLHQKISKKEAKKQVIDLFKQVKLPRPEHIYKSYPHEISGGQKQRVMIAMAIANKPDLLIADEPTTALDVTVQKEIILLLKDLKETYNMSLLFISHDLGVVSEIADEVAVMYKGELVEKGDIRTVFSNPKHPYTKGLLECRPPIDKRPDRLPTVDEFLNENRGVEVKSKKTTDSERKSRQNRMYAGEPMLNVQKLEKKFILKKSMFGKAKAFVHAVDHVNLDVFPGETLGLVGESGCGKTTLGRSILRLIEPDSGKVIFEEQDILNFNQQDLKRERKNINIVFQDPYSSLNPRLSIGNAILEPMQVHGLHKNNRERKKKVIELLEKVGLKAEQFHRYPHEFSGGQRQRIVIARALALNPKFIICDEAVSALDVSVQAKVLNLLNDLKREFGFTYIFISHDLSVVRYMSDRIMVMKEGEIIESGDADELYWNPKTTYTQQLIQSIPKGIYND